MSLRLSLIDLLKDSIIDGVITQAEVLVALHEATGVAKYDKVIAAAREDGRINDDLEIDDYPLLSITDDGTWVSAWIWVAKYDNEIARAVAQDKLDYLA